MIQQAIRVFYIILLIIETAQAGFFPDSGHEIKCKRGLPVNLLDHVPYGPKLNCYACKCPDGFVKCEELPNCMQRHQSSFKTVSEHPISRQRMRIKSTPKRAQEPIRIGQITYELAGPSASLGEHERVAESVLGDKWTDVRESLMRRLHQNDIRNGSSYVETLSTQAASVPTTSPPSTSPPPSSTTTTERPRTAADELAHDLKTLDLTTHSVRITWRPPLELAAPTYTITYDAPEKHFIDNQGLRQWLSVPAKTLNTTDTQIFIHDLMPYTTYRLNVTATPAKQELLATNPPVTVHITTALAAPKPMQEPTLIGLTPSGREYELFLPWASEEYGPIGYYQVVVVPADMPPPPEPDSYTTADLLAATSEKGPYIAAKFSKIRMVRRFILGDNCTYDGFVNRPLNKDQQYHVFVRAVVEHSESLYTSSPMSEAVSLAQQKPDIQPSPPSSESFREVRWILVLALAAVMAPAVVMLLACIVTIFYKRQRLDALKTHQAHDGTTTLPLPDHMYSSVPVEPSEGGGNISYPSGAMLYYPPVVELADHIEFLKMNNNLKDEYESIEPGGKQQFTWENSIMECNRAKNRYANVVAYDHSRVVLGKINGAPGSDYINANYCDGYSRQNEYIATQGPLPNTVGDFWRMVWEQNSRTIVMMSQLEEGGRVKCVQYWPSKDHTLTYHGISITAINLEEFAYYNLRTFELQCNNEKRELRQFQFTGWPDRGVPDNPSAFLMFLRRVKAWKPANAGPMIVLCSAGVGRTGCFIVINSIIQQLRQEKTIDIYRHVTKLRAQRNHLVQTKLQYMFIYDAVLESISASNNSQIAASKPMNDTQKLMQPLPNENTTGVELEFKRLASMF